MFSSAEVSKQGTTCSMQLIDGVNETGVSISIGKTRITSQFSLITSERLSVTDRELTLSLRSRTEQVDTKARWSRDDLAQGLYVYRTGLSGLGIDLERIQAFGGLHLTSEEAGTQPVKVLFSGSVRDEALVQMQSCLDSLDEYWSLEG